MRTYVPISSRILDIVGTNNANDMFERLKIYLQETRIELKKVTWPSRQQTIRYTAAVIAISAGVGAFLGGLDFLFQWVLNKFIL